MGSAEVVREACRVIWTEGQLDRVGEFYGEDFKADYPRTDWGVGVAGVRALASGIRRGMPDYREHIDELIEAGDRVTVVLTIQGTHTGELDGVAPTGMAVTFRDVSILRVRDGKIVEQRGLSDHFELYRQLGLIEMKVAG